MFTAKKSYVFSSLLVLGVLASVDVSYAQGDSEGRMEERVSPSSYAEKNEYVPYMGLTGGVNNPSDYSSTAELGVVGGIQPEMGVGVGGEINTTSLDDTDRTQRTIALAQAAYKFGGDVPVARNSYFAIGAGPAFVKTQVKWAIAPAVGFDIPITTKTRDTVSLGVNAKYVGVTNSVDSYVGSAAVKYWY